jgi:GGDEF domain-containing protein
VNVLDPTTVFVVGGLVVFLAGTAFLLETMLRRNDPVGRLWSIFFLSAMFAVFAFVVVSLDPDIWWANAAGNGAYVTAIGFLWSGARRANGRGAFHAVPIALGVAVTVAGLLPGANGGYWAGSFEMFIGVAVTSLLTAFEFARGDLARLLASRVLTVLIGGMGLYYVARAIAFVALGPDDPAFDIFFGTAISTLIEICFTVVGTIMLASVQGDRFAQLHEDDAEIGARLRIDGVMNAREFREVAETWLMRALRERATLVLLLIDVADLGAVNTAFGRAAGDAAVRTTGRIAITQAPTSALVGHLSTRRFALLFELPANDSVGAVADRIGEAVLGAMIDDRDRFRASTFQGVATTHTSGARYGDLLAAAEEAVAMEETLAHASQREAAENGS